MYVYNRIPTELLDSIIAQTEWRSDKEYLIIFKHQEGNYGFLDVNGYEHILTIFDVPNIVGIKFLGNVEKENAETGS
jgi:hypothetical protein